MNIEPGPDGRVLLSCWELSQLFGVYEAAIRAHIKALIKSGAIKPGYEGLLVQSGKTLLPERFDVAMVVALAFRIDSPTAARIRDYVIRKATTRSDPPIFISYDSGSTVN